MTKSTFSERLNLIINERGIRQIDLCQQTGIGKSAMSQYLSGSFEPKQQKLHILAAALNVSEAWLMGYDVPRERKPAGDAASLQVMEVIAPDNSMAAAHIPMGAMVTVVPGEIDPVTAGVDATSDPIAASASSTCDFTNGIIAADGKIVCWSTDNTNYQFRYLHIGNGTFILTAADPGITPEIFSFNDLDNGKLIIHGIVQKVVINF